jgi:prepilin-type N-terminal cleavage/methylation domain-containing protein
MRGFSLIEMMIALVVLTFGLLTAGQMLLIAASSSSLARSKGAAAIIAQDRLESLASLYQQDPSNSDLLLGDHGPLQTEIANSANETILNRYRITWNVSAVPDPRPGLRLDSRRVSVRITPALPGGAENSKPGMNKILNVSTILGPSAR